MISVCNVKKRMKCVNTLRTGRHKRQAGITLLFQYTSYRGGDGIKHEHSCKILYV